MSPRSRWVDALLLGSTLLLGAYLLGTSGAPTKAQEQARAEHLLQHLIPSELDSLTLKSDGEELTLLADSKRPGEYIIQGEGEGRADAALVRELLSSLDFATFKRRLTQLPHAVATQEPQLSVKVASKRQSSTIHFFSATETSELDAQGEVYVEVISSGVRRMGVVEGRLLSTLKRSRQEFRGSQLFPFSIETTLSLDVISPSHELRLVADELGFLVNSGKRRADRRLTDLLFYHLAQANISSFVPQQRAQETIESAQLKYSIVQRGPGKTIRVEVGGSCPNDPSSTLAWRKTDPPIAGCIASTVFAGLSLDAGRISDRTATVLTSDEIDHVIIEGQDRSLDLLRKDTGFILPNQQQRAVPPAAGEEYLRLLAEGQLQLLSDPPKPGGTALTMTIVGNPREKALDKEPWLQKTASAHGPERRLLLDIYRGEERTLIHRRDDRAWLEVPRALDWVFNQDDAWTQERKLDTPRAEALDWLELKSSSSQAHFPRTEQPLRLARDNSAYSLLVGRKSSDGVLRADQSLGRRMFEHLAELEALRFLPDRGAPDSPWYEIRFAEKESDRVLRLVVGARVRGGYRAWLQGHEPQFVLSYETARLLSVPPFDRSAAQIEPDRFSTLTLNSGGRRLELVRIADQFQTRGGDFPEQELRPLLDELRAVQVLAYLPKPPSGKKSTLNIEATTIDEGSTLSMNILGLVPFMDHFAYEAQIEGHRGTYYLSADSVRALVVLL